MSNCRKLKNAPNFKVPRMWLFIHTFTLFFPYAFLLSTFIQIVLIFEVLVFPTSSHSWAGQPGVTIYSIY